MFRSPSPLLHGSYQGTDNANNLGRLKDVSSPASVVAQNTSATNEALMNSDTVAADEVQSPHNPLDTEKSQHGNGESDFPCNDTARNEALPDIRVEMIPNDQPMISFLCNTESVSSNQPSQIIQQQESDLISATVFNDSDTYTSSSASHPSNRDESHALSISSRRPTGDVGISIPSRRHGSATPSRRLTGDEGYGSATPSHRLTGDEDYGSATPSCHSTGDEDYGSATPSCHSTGDKDYGSATPSRCPTGDGGISIPSHRPTSDEGYGSATANRRPTSDGGISIPSHHPINTNADNNSSRFFPVFAHSYDPKESPNKTSINTNCDSMITEPHIKPT